MDLYEYQAKELFATHGVPVLPGRTVETPEEAAAMRARIAQVEARPGFGGIDDPRCFNPDWRDLYAATVVNGSSATWTMRNPSSSSGACAYRNTSATSTSPRRSICSASTG